MIRVFFGLTLTLVSTILSRESSGNSATRTERDMENLKFYLTIGCENAAFEPGHIDEEVARILRKLADRMVRDGDDEYRLTDSNGNVVGRAIYKNVVGSSSLRSEGK